MQTAAICEKRCPRKNANGINGFWVRTFERHKCTDAKKDVPTDNLFLAMGGVLTAA
jgi:hypothetical protein